MLGVIIAKWGGELNGVDDVPNRYFLNYNTKGDYQTELKYDIQTCSNLSSNATSYRLSQTELTTLLLIKKILVSPFCYQ